MSDSISPTEIEIGGIKQYDDDEEILNTMSELKKIDSSDSFQHQFVDLGGEGVPIVQFSSEVENADDQEVVVIRRKDDTEEGTSALQIFLDFPYESLTTFSATLNEILDIIESLTVEHLNTTYRVNRELLSLEMLGEVNEHIDYELRGLRVAHEEFTYIIQSKDEQTSIMATIDEEQEISAESNEDFIKEEVDTATRFVEGLCND